MKKELIKAVLTANLNMLFGVNDYRIIFPSGSGIIIIVENKNTNASAKLEIHNDRFVAVEYLMYGDYDDEDLVACITRSIKRLNVLLKKDVIYILNDYVITAFNEITIKSDDGLIESIISYNGVYSSLITRNGKSITIPRPKEYIKERIDEALKEHHTIDFNNASLSQLVDYTEYVE